MATQSLRTAVALAVVVASGGRVHASEPIQRFDPAHPDPVERWSLPASPRSTTSAPEGR